MGIQDKRDFRYKFIRVVSSGNAGDSGLRAGLADKLAQIVYITAADFYFESPGCREGLVAAFPELFGDCPNDLWQDENLLAEIRHCFAGIPRDDILHIPGQIYEMVMAMESAEAGSSPARKSRGSYFTPLAVVRHMVNRAGRHLFGPGARKADGRGFMALDPACGGAAFLLEIFGFLLRSGVPAQEAGSVVYGLDIDPQAVNLSRFVMTCAIMAATGSDSPDRIKEAIANRIKQGNSLSAKIEPGFALVIGNPPYVANKLIPAKDKADYRQNFASATGQFDLAVPFLEQGIRLLRPGGVMSFITSNKFMAADYGREIRRILVCETRILELTDVSSIRAFGPTAAYPVIITARRETPSADGDDVGICLVTAQDLLSTTKPEQISQGFFRTTGDFIITTRVAGGAARVITKIACAAARIPREIIRCGLAQTGFNRWVTKGASTLPAGHSPGEQYPFIQAGHIRPYRLSSHDWINPACITKRRLSSMTGRRLVIPGMAKRLTAALDETDSLLGRVYYIREDETTFDLSYLTVLFNSLVLNFYYQVMYWPVHLDGGYLRFNSSYLANLPLPQGFSEEDYRVREIIRLGSLLADPDLPPQTREDLSSAAEARVFALYGIDRAEAGVITKFMGIRDDARDKIFREMGSEIVAGKKSRQ